MVLQTGLKSAARQGKRERSSGVGSLCFVNIVVGIR